MMDKRKLDGTADESSAELQHTVSVNPIRLYISA